MMSVSSSPVALIRGPDLTLMPDTLPGLAANVARRAADRPDGIIRSIEADGTARTLGFADIWQRSGAIAVALEAAGIADGRLVLLVFRDILEYVPAFWACIRVGATAVPLGGITRSTSPRDLAGILARLDQPALLCDGRMAKGIDALLAILPDAPVVDTSTIPAAARGEPGAHAEAAIPCLTATSGSTGKVKFVACRTDVWLHRCYSENYTSRGLDTNCLGVFPFDSLGGYRSLFLNYASWTQLPSQVLDADPALILTTAARYAAKVFHTTNSMAARLAETKIDGKPTIDLSALTHVGLGGEAVTRRVSTAFRDFLVRLGAPKNVVGAGYGTTETSFLLAGVDPTTTPLDETGALNLGGCAAGITLRIVDDAGTLCEEGEVGNVEIHAPLTMFTSYWGEPEASAACFTPDGWWKTGDLGVISGGDFFFRGRAKETLVIGGRKFSLTDIESHLQGDPSVLGRTIPFVMRRADSVTDGLGIAVVRDAGRTEADAAAPIRASIVRRYGFPPAGVMTIAETEIPLTATGKVDRLALTRRAAETTTAAPVALMPPPGEDRDAILAELWCEALDLYDAIDPDVTFEDYGGDSLRLTTLIAAIDVRLGLLVPLPEFFEVPTFRTLCRLAAQAPQRRDAETTTDLWPLPLDVQRGIQSFVEMWSGTRVTADRLLLGRNVGGTRPPVFAVFNAADELDQLAEALGPDRPTYAFRSAHKVGTHDEDLIQRIALRYVQDILEVAPRGPLLLLGQCQGGVIALAVAQHLLRRGRHVPLLVLVEWSPPEPASYPEAALIIYGRDSAMNPKLYHADPALPWRRLAPNHEYIEVDGGYGQVFARWNIASLAAVLEQGFARALARAPRQPPRDAYSIEVAADIAWRQTPGKTVLVRTTVKNTGHVVVSSQTSGVMLGVRWAQDGALVKGGVATHALLPDIAPQQSIELPLAITLPERAGRYLLALDLVEEGRDWLGAAANDGRAAEIFVL